jgi:nitric oxide synthase oxygenase domain/subunit
MVGSSSEIRHPPAPPPSPQDLTLLDYRHVDTPEGMFQACLELLEVATLSCVTTANIVCFRPQTPGTQDGPRVWNSQLIRFAG